MNPTTPKEVFLAFDIARGFKSIFITDSNKVTNLKFQTNKLKETKD